MNYTGLTGFTLESVYVAPTSQSIIGQMEASASSHALLLNGKRKNLFAVMAGSDDLQIGVAFILHGEFLVGLKKDGSVAIYIHVRASLAPVFENPGKGHRVDRKGDIFPALSWPVATSQSKSGRNMLPGQTKVSK